MERIFNKTNKIIAKTMFLDDILGDDNLFEVRIIKHKIDA